MTEEECVSDSETYGKLDSFYSRDLLKIYILLLVLVPVNEYRMADKIQTANDLLFSPTAEEGGPTETEASLEEVSARLVEMKLQPKHRVTFSSDVEEIEDETGDCGARGVPTEEYYDDNEDQINEEINEIFDRDATLPVVVDLRFECSPKSELPPQEIREESSATPVSPSEPEQPKETPIAEPERSAKGVEREPSSKRPRSTQRETKITRKKSSEEDLLKIHLNVRKCCESKHLESHQLPRYRGYLSQYGLSKDQLEERERNRSMSQQRQYGRRLENHEQQQRQSEMNEEAFRQWLRRKAAKKQLKKRNMYNVNKV